MQNITAKWISSFFLFIITLVVSVLPVILFNWFAKIKKKKKNNYDHRCEENFNISNQNASTTKNINLSTNADNKFVIEDEYIFRHTYSNSITSINSISSIQLNKKSSKVLQIFIFFGGGVLLATCFCHLIPEIKENYEKYQLKNHKYLAKKSFSNVYLGELNTDQTNIETTTLPDLLLNNEKLTDLPLSSKLHAHSHDEEIYEINYKTTQNPSIDLHHNNEKSSGHHFHEHDNIPLVEIAICGGFFLIYLLEVLISRFLDNHSHNLDDNSKKKSLPYYENYAIDFNPELLASVKSSKNNSIKKDENLTGGNSKIKRNLIDECKNKQKVQPATVRFIEGLLTIGAFSAHSIFDGLAIGLQTTTSHIYTTLFAISMHKLVVAFSIGLKLYDQTCSVYMTLILMTLFSLNSPLGIWIAIYSQNTSDLNEDQSLLLIMLNAIACGTIIYIVFFEMIQKDHSDRHVNGILLWIFMLSGFILMLLINLFIVG